jgi:UDP-N-acetylmuramoylalanine--D-glutamate ligase
MIVPSSISKQKFGILGLGRSGLASTAALATAGAQIFAHDDHIQPDLPHGASSTPPSDWPWDQLEAVIISPGIPHLHPEPHPIARMAAQHGIAIISDIEMMMKAKPKAKLIGITGTNGKSTVVSLIKHILDHHGIQATLGGNIGTPVMALDDPGEDGVIILELSSYQLDTTPSLCLDAGAVINITPDHLDRHGGWDGYVAAKTRLAQAVKDTGLLLLGDDRTTAAIKTAATAEVKIAHGEDALNRNLAPSLVGPHNAINTVIATAIAEFCGLTKTDVAAALPSFKGLQHRMELIGTAGEIRFINDSKATNGEAAAEALKSFKAIYWIAGGLSKDGGLGVAAQHLHDVRCVYLIGDSAERFAEQLGTTCRHQIAGSLDVATAAAFNDAQGETPSHDQATILLSPAAASFDQFDNFEARGEAFRLFVHDLLEQHSATEKRSQEVRHV